jgi:uncharacterized membrane protein
MIVLAVLTVATLLFRGAGVLGIEAFDSWLVAVRWGLATMLLLTASAHFTARKDDLIRMVPKWMPRPHAVIFVTGILEILGAVGLLFPLTQRLSALCLILLFLAMLPANVRAAHLGLTMGGRPATPLWLRVPMQLLFIALTWVAGFY